MRKIKYLARNGEFKIGWFHQWASGINYNGYNEIYAVIEKDDGDIILQSYKQVSFVNSPEGLKEDSGSTK